MIDINKLINDAIKTAVREIFDELEMRIEGINGRLNNHISASVQAQAPNLGQLRAQFAEDIEQVLVRIRQVDERVDIVRDAASTHIKDFRQTLSGMQERFALKDVVDTGYSALVQQVAQLDEDIQSAHRQINTLDRDARTNELDSQEVADVIADLFSDGTLTITIDKV